MKKLILLFLGLVLISSGDDDKGVIPPSLLKKLML